MNSVLGHIGARLRGHWRAEEVGWQRSEHSIKLNSPDLNLTLRAQEFSSCRKLALECLGCGIRCQRPSDCQSRVHLCTCVCDAGVEKSLSRGHLLPACVKTVSRGQVNMWTRVFGTHSMSLTLAQNQSLMAHGTKYKSPFSLNAISGHKIYRIRWLMACLRALCDFSGGFYPWALKYLARDSAHRLGRKGELPEIRSGTHLDISIGI